MIVLDASAALEMLLRRPAAREVEELALGPGESLHAPELLDIEVAQVLRRFAAMGSLTQSRGALALADLEGLQMQRYSHGPLLGRVWELRHNFSAYDAAYVSLAEILGAALLTCDARLAKAGAKWVKVRLVTLA